MNTTLKRQDFFSPFVIIIFTALIVQLIGRYYAPQCLVIGSYFYALWVVLRIAVPLAVLFMLRVPVRALGLGVPRIDRRFRNVILVMAAILIAVFAALYFYQGYFSSYTASFHSGDYSKLDRFVNFMIFTSSTLTGWEFLHRAFLLMGLAYVLQKNEKFDERTAMIAALCVVWVFEVVFHFIKPVLEPVGLLVGSPLLSYIALRTRSIWPAFLSHLLVEILFIASLIFR